MTISSRALAACFALGAVACSSAGSRGPSLDDGPTSITTVSASAGSDETSTTHGDGPGSGSLGETETPFPDLPSAGDEVTGGCADVTASIDKSIATIVLLIDQSSSMYETLEGGVTRWEALRSVLFDPGTSVIAALQAETKFGMTMYWSNNGGPTCPILTDVPPAFDNLDAMAAAFTTPANDGDTPTGDAIRQVAEALVALGDDTAKAIVLATDGEPDTCAVPDPQQGQPQSLAAAQMAHAMGVSTFVISVGSEVSDLHLQQLANVGVGYDVLGSESAPFFKTNNVAELANAFATLITAFVPCSFTIDGEVVVDLACMGTVVLDGVELECGLDWDVPEPSTLRLLGEACEALQDGEQHQVSATFPCPVINIP